MKSNQWVIAGFVCFAILLTWAGWRSTAELVSKMNPPHGGVEVTHAGFEQYIETHSRYSINLYTIEGHKYIVAEAGARDGGIHIIHAAHCRCNIK